MPSSAVDRPTSMVRSFAPSLFLVVAACAGADAAAPPLPEYRVTASGRVDAGSDSRFLVAEQDGRIDAVRVAEGDRVAAGQVLLTIACDDLAADRAAAAARADAAAASARLVKAGLREEERDAATARQAQALAQLADAQDLLARSRKLVEQGFVSQRRLEELGNLAAGRSADAAVADAGARAARAGARPDERRAAEALAEAARASALALAARVERCTLRTPIAGTVLKILHRPGEFSAASTGAPLVVVGDLDAIIVRAEVADRDAGLITVGQPVRVWMDGNSREWSGTVARSSQLMGRKTARSLDPSDRFDRDVREVIIAFPGPNVNARPPALVGLRVNVGFPA